VSIHCTAFVLDEKGVVMFMTGSLSSNLDLWKNKNFNYPGENHSTSFFSHEASIHPYPAKAVPDMVHDILKIISHDNSVINVLDPFVGSGTVGLESKFMGFNFYGSDLNPLSILLSRTKTLTVNNTEDVKRDLKSFLNDLNDHIKLKKYEIVTFDNINYWFLDKQINDLSFIKSEIRDFIKNSDYRCRETYSLILLTAFSMTIRSVSLTRNGEFKLYRLAPSKIKELETHPIDTIEVYKSNVNQLLDTLKKINAACVNPSTTNIYLKNAKNLDYLDANTISLILTSPPYGDSKSTVAYGQFSKLSLQWIKDLLNKYLNIPVDYVNCDEYLLGGQKSKIINDNENYIKNSKILQKLYDEMNFIVKGRIRKLNEHKDKIEAYEGATGNKLHEQEALLENEELAYLIREKIRLDIFRKINKQGKLDTKKIKKISRNLSEHYMLGLLSENPKIRYESQKYLYSVIGSILKSIKGKIKNQPKRIREIMVFFKDLYEAVIETDRVLKKGGIQVWIVGNRTVLENIKINMADIINEWFRSMGYTQIKLLQRDYSFKRMPKVINSSLTRHEGIPTMMKEHILIVKK
jgi:tRNA G10  N-methylase Trm11